MSELELELLTALADVVKWRGQRCGESDGLLPAEKQSPEIATAMRLIERCGKDDEKVAEKTAEQNPKT